MKKAELEAILRDEETLYFGENGARKKQMRKIRSRRYVIWCYLTAFRKCQYWKAIRESREAPRLQRKTAKYRQQYYDKKRNRLSERCGVEIGIDCCLGKNLDIWHGGIVVNGCLGDNCTLHGNNIIGNKGKNRETEHPVIADNVDIGAGASIIGGVEIASDAVIGAGAVVTRSITQKGAVAVGVPAKVIGTRGDN